MYPVKYIYITGEYRIFPAWLHKSNLPRSKYGKVNRNEEKKKSSKQTKQKFVHVFIIFSMTSVRFVYFWCKNGGLFRTFFFLVEWLIFCRYHCEEHLVPPKLVPAIPSNSLMRLKIPKHAYPYSYFRFKTTSFFILATLTPPSVECFSYTTPAPTRRSGLGFTKRFTQIWLANSPAT